MITLRAFKIITNLQSKKPTILSWFLFFFISVVSITLFVITWKNIDISSIIGIFLGIGFCFLLIKYPEFALALFAVAGKFKADPRLEFLRPLDITLAFAFFLVSSIIISLIIKKQKPRIPRIFAFYIPFVLMMLISLSYTPRFDVGLDKAARFILLTGLAIIAPFWVLTSVTKLKRFFIALFAVGLLECINSLAMLGRGEWFVSPSGLNIQLGFDAAVSIIVLWCLILYDTPFLKRIPWYSIFPILFIGLVGAAARRAIVSLSLFIILGAFYNRKMIVDLVILSALGILVINIVDIPITAYDNISTIVKNKLPDLFGFRTNLMDLGIELTKNNPIKGVGIGGYRYSSPNPAYWDHPHNIFFEISSEIGIFAAISVLILQVASLWEAAKSILDKNFFYNQLMFLILSILLVGLVESQVSGEINDLKFMWLSMSLPFVLRNIHLDRLIYSERCAVDASHSV